MPVLKVGESRWYEAFLLKEAEVEGSPIERVKLPDGSAAAAFSEDTSGSVMSIEEHGRFVKVTGQNNGVSTLTVTAYYPDDPNASQTTHVEFIVLQAGSPGDIFGADLADAGAFTAPP